ncbi:chemotaxis protein MotB [Caldalkalibacillus uzonensis]|uniref:Chemotaxis protein MotB n=1 Tax=Caldalkalibacillus uzonensis TaxID=353224 RepID=A0ABU0CPR0_9BACI|nr:OmpA family protein [Caldalkalibacillus uzonensis]MDQ0338409.1 chemotaxis protein MotB [Caldalkalibacillus uzonensis]
MNHKSSSKSSFSREPRQRWLVTFADLMMIVLVTFVLLYSYSEINMQKFHSVLDSFNKRIPLEGESLPPAEPGFDKDIPGPEQGEEAHPTQEVSPQEEEQTIDLDQDLQEQLADLLAREQKMKAILEYVQGFAHEHQLEEELIVKRTARGIELVLPEVMLFPSGQADLIDEAIIFLDELAPLLQEIPHLIEVEGHTDNRPISNVRFPSNWELSTARATQVIRHLVEEHGLDPQRFKAVGYGEYHPVASNDSEEGRSQNRRVVMVILLND